MRVFRCGAVGVLVIGLATLAAAGDSNEALLKEVEAIGDSLAEAMLSDDVDFMLGMYAEGAISLPNYGPRMEGKEAFKKAHAESAAAGMKIMSFESHPTDAWECGDQVIEIGVFEITLQPPGMPGPVTDKGKYMTVYERQANGSLKIKVETWNSDLDPMTMMAGG
jgi:ketosteroid isomerase-like protein